MKVTDHETESLEFVLLNQFIEVDVQQLEGDTLVVPEGEVVQHVDDMVGAVRVLSAEVIQNPNLFFRLPVESLLIPDQLQRHVLLILVVVGLDDLKVSLLTSKMARGTCPKEPFPITLSTS